MVRGKVVVSRYVVVLVLVKVTYDVVAMTAACATDAANSARTAVLSLGSNMFDSLKSEAEEAKRT